jgi:hypothetical protein
MSRHLRFASSVSSLRKYLWTSALVLLLGVAPDFKARNGWSGTMAMTPKTRPSCPVFHLFHLGPKEMPGTCHLL